MISDVDIVRDSCIHGDRHLVRLTHVPSKTTVEYESRLPYDKKKDAQARADNNKKAFEKLKQVIENRASFPVSAE